MKRNKNIKSAAIVLPFMSFILIFLVSCNYVLEDKNKYSSDIVTTNQNIINNKQEAKLLVKASQNSLDVIGLCKLIEEAKIEDGVGSLAEELEKTHLEIFKEYKEMAQEKLISIPNYSNIEIQNKNGEEKSFIETNLNLISQKINNQIECMNKLSKHSNSEFKELSQKTNPILKSKLDKTENTIRNLKV